MTHDRVRLGDMVRIDRIGPRDIRDGAIEPGDILAPAATRGSFVLCTTALPRAKGQRTALRIRANRAPIDPHWLFWLLQTHLGDLRSDEDGPRRIDPDLLARLEVALPPLPEQRHHADLLDRVDRLRGRDKASGTTPARLRGAIYHRFFGDRQDSRWHHIPLGELALLRPVRPGARRERMPGSGVGKRLIAIRGSGAGCGTVQVIGPDEKPRGEQIAVIRHRPDFKLDWLAEALRQANLARHAAGSTVPHLTVAVLERVGIPVPPRELQERFAAEARKTAALAAASEKASEEIHRLWWAIGARAFATTVFR